MICLFAEKHKGYTIRSCFGKQNGGKNEFYAETLGNLQAF